jgi:uncharacterized protein YoxC
LGGWALLVVAAFWAVLVGFLSFSLISLFRVLTATRDLLEDFRRQATPMLQELNETVENVNKEIGQVDQILSSARGTIGAVESVSKTVQTIVTHPAIRMMALAAGAGRAWRRLRRSSSE